jgi:hypothetical protein
MPGAIISDLSTVLQRLAAAEREAADLVTGLSTTQANWRPNGGNSWSIVQCLNHLARINRVYSTAMYEAARSRTGEGTSSRITPGWFGAWFVRSMEPPVRTKMKSPRKVIPIAVQIDPIDALAEFVESHEPVRGVIEASRNLDVNRVRFKNPFLSILRFTIGTGLMIINAHDRRHLWQAAQLKSTAGFPTA